MRFRLIRGDFIQLNQLLKAAGVDDDYIRIRHLIRDGKVSVNNETILRVEHEVRIGDVVRCLKHHIIVTDKDELSRDYVPQQNIRHGKLNQWKYKPLQDEKTLNRRLRDVSTKFHKKMLVSNLKVAFAESCTGGMIQSYLTAYPGASAYFNGGVVVYSNQSKEIILGVKSRTLLKYGAVSSETALEMAEGVRKKFHSDLAGAVTGVAGPEGGTPEKPVGTVFIAVDDRGETRFRELHINGKRDVVRKETVIAILNFMLEKLK